LVGSISLEATATGKGITLSAGTGNIGFTGNIIPSANTTYDLGSGTYSMQNVYTHDGGVETSDLRLKTTTGSDLGLDFLKKLTPIEFTWKPETILKKVKTTEVVDGKPITTETEEETQKTFTRKHWGVTAQNIKQSLIDLSLDPSDYGVWCLSNPLDETSKQMVRYQGLICVLVKAVQELDARLAALE
jgi:hypothetical protein